MRRTLTCTLALLMVLVTALPLLGSAADTHSGGWVPPIAIDSDASLDAGGPTLGVSATTADGHVLAAWTMGSGTQWVQYAIFDPATGWGPTLTYSNFFGSAYGPAVVALPNGSFYMAVSDTGLLWPSVVGAMWTPDVGWHSWVGISSDHSMDSFDTIRLAAAGNGDIFAVWRADDGTETNLTAARFTASGGWDTTQPVIESYTNDPSSYYVRLAADGSGNAIAAWLQNDGSNQRAFANRYVVGSGWGGSGTAIDSSGQTTSRVDLAVDTAGNAVAVLAQFGGTTYHVYSNIFTVGSGWGTPEKRSLDDSYSATESRVAGSAGGQFAAVWLQGGASYQDIHTATYSSSGGWTEVHNATAGLDAAQQPSVAVSASGAVHVVFMAWSPGAPGVMHPYSAMWTAAGGWGETDQMSLDTIFAGDTSCSSGEACSSFLYLSAGSFSKPGVARYVGAPALTVSGPEDAATTTEPTVVVSGHTTPGATVTVSGVTAEVSPSGDFSVRVALAAGENMLVITSVGQGGSTSTSTRTVTFNDPVPGLADELEHTHDALHTAQGDLAAAQADLAATQANLTATQTALDAATAAQNTAREAQQASIDASAGSAGTAMILGLLGLVVGLAAIAMAFMMRGKGGGSAPSMAPPPKAEGEAKP